MAAAPSNGTGCEIFIDALCRRYAAPIALDLPTRGLRPGLQFGRRYAACALTSDAICDLRPALCDLRRVPCDLRPAPCALQPATCNLQPAICDLRSAICR